MDDGPCGDLGEPGWSVLWPTSLTRTDDASALHPALEGWEDLADRERSLGIKTRAPILVSPDGTVDPDIDRYINRSGFLRHALPTQEKYLAALVRLLDLVSSRGRGWRETTADDLYDLYDWRTDASPRAEGEAMNRRPVKPQTWNSQLPGITGFFDWADRRHLLAGEHPVERRALYARQDEDEHRPAPVASGKPANVAVVKWRTAAAFRQFRALGFQGYGADGLRDPSWRGRTGPRDTAFADYGWESGLRAAELNGLLLHELPDVRQDRQYYRGRVTGKGRKTRDYWVAHHALQQALDYAEADRAESVDSAKRARRYDKVDGLLVVTETDGGKVFVAESKDPDIAAGQWLDLARTDASVRLRLYAPGADGFPEPMHLWLTEGGLPSTESAFQSQFRTASARARRLRPDLDLSMTCHAMRHSFALHMLLALWRALRLRSEGTPGGDEVSKLYGDHWTLVQQMLGHSSQDTTRSIYLEPLQGLQIDDLLNDEDLLSEAATADTLVPRVARRSRLVLSLPEEAVAGATFPEDEPEDQPVAVNA